MPISPEPRDALAPTSAKRVIHFEGRQVTVPGDATDEEVAQILGGELASPSPSPTAAPAATTSQLQGGVKLDINGRRVEVDGSFLSMSPEQQNATVDEIARSIGVAPAAPTTQGSKASLAELEDALRNADAAGDVAAARQLADEIVHRRSLRPTAPAGLAAPAKPSANMSDFLNGTGAFGGAAMHRFETEGPDGAKYELEAPDEQAAVRAFKKYLAGARSSSSPTSQVGTQPPAEPVNQGVDAPLYVMQQANRGLADAAGAPVDLMSAGLNVGLWGADKIAGLFGGNVDTRIEKPVGGSDWIADRASQANEAIGGNLVPEEAVSPGARVLGSGARFGTSALAAAGSLASKGAAKVAENAPDLLSRVLRPLTAPYRQSSAAAAGDTAAGVGAGLSTGAYDEYAPDSVKDFVGPFGPAMAALTGGLGGAATHAAGSGARQSAQNLARDLVYGKGDPTSAYNPVTGKREFTRSQMDEAARSVQAQASDPAAAAANINRNVSAIKADAAPGQLPTSGAVSDDAGLVLLEREARARNPKPFLERDQATNARAGEIVRGTAPVGAEARDFTDASSEIFQGRKDLAQSQLDQVRASAHEFENSVRRQSAPIAAGAGQGVDASRNLDALVVEQSLKPMQARKNDAFGAIDPDRSVVRDATPLIDAAEKIRANLGRLNDPNSILPMRTLDRIAALSGRDVAKEVDTGLLDEFGRPLTRSEASKVGGDGTITFGELNALRPELSAALNKARSAGDYALADNIHALQGAIHKETDRLAADATPAGLRAAAAKKIYGEEFAPTWNVGPGDEATRFRRDVNADRVARTQSPPSATAGRFLRPGQPEKAASLQRIISTLPDQSAAQAEARRFLISDLAEAGAVDAATGHLRPDALRRWRNQWGATIDAVPGVRAEVDALLASADDVSFKSGQFARDVRAAEQGLDDTIKNTGALGLALGKDPINAVEAVFSAGDPERAMTAIVHELGTNRRAKEGLQASVVDFIAGKTTDAALQRTADGSRPVDFARLENLFNRHELTLAKVFSPEQMNALRQAHKLLKPQMAIKQQGAAGVLYDGKKAEQAWRLLEGGLKAKFGVLKGGGVLRTIRVFAASLPNSDQAVQDIIVRMHFDPELAMHLLKRDVPVDTPIWNKRLNRLLALATGARANGEDEKAMTTP